VTGSAPRYNLASRACVPEGGQSLNDPGRFFRTPILNSPYGCPNRHWELDEQGQPTQSVIEARRLAKFVSPIPKSRKQKGKAKQADLPLYEGPSGQDQKYDPTPVINELRWQVDQWRKWPNPADWQVTPETARLLDHWRNHPFSSIRPFFGQIEAVETAIWLTEVAPNGKSGKTFSGTSGECK